MKFSIGVILISASIIMSVHFRADIGHAISDLDIPRMEVSSSIREMLKLPAVWASKVKGFFVVNDVDVNYLFEMHESMWDKNDAEFEEFLQTPEGKELAAILFFIFYHMNHDVDPTYCKQYVDVKIWQDKIKAAHVQEYQKAKDVLSINETELESLYVLLQPRFDEGFQNRLNSLRLARPGESDSEICNLFANNIDALLPTLLFSVQQPKSGLYSRLMSD